MCDEALVETKTYGTVTHMPPELLLEGKLSKSADVYAFGVLLFELFTADRPWGGLRHAEVLHKVAVKHERLKLPEDAPQLFQVCSCHYQDSMLISICTLLQASCGSSQTRPMDALCQGPCLPRSKANAEVSDVQVLTAHLQQS